MTTFKEEDLFPATRWHDIGDDIAWRPYKHWGTGVWAGEGLTIHNGDRSGCIHEVNGHKWTNRPVVVEARCYRKGNYDVSAVFSYPNGIGFEDHYFWETYDFLEGEIHRFVTEEDMEQFIKVSCRKLFPAIS